MVTNAFLALALFLYLAVFAVFLYVCLIADPETSRMARLFNEEIPTGIWNWLGNRLSRNTVNFLVYFSDRFLLLIYCTVVYGAWSLIFWLVYPWITRSHTVSSIHKHIGYLFFIACISSWRLATKSSPGIITAKTLHRYDHFPHDNILFEAKCTCRTTGIPKVARSMFDRHKYNANVPRFDHFCGWVHNTIGEENYRWFLLFLLIHFAMCAYGSLVVWWLFVGEVKEKELLQVTYVDRFTGELIPSSKIIVAQYLFNRYLWEAGIFMLMSVMAVALVGFLIYHVYLTSYGMTTNESYKWSYIRTWYKRELKEYEQAVKTRSAAPEQKSATKVTKVKQDQSRQDFARDPGLPPVNIYDRGFMENWREVMFPISLREDRSYNGSARPKYE
ncbi:hypothetical protein MPSEU_000473100 [Mayamaea pseudoterrestris]|nr:hypothetical protein MPSEU_000473100 [Mayamaea pseudoterrestris]